MLMASCDTNSSTSGVTLPKSHVALHFHNLDLRKAMMPLTMLLASYDADASASVITWPKQPCCISVWSSLHVECNGIIDDTVSITWHWHQCQWCHMTKKCHIALYFNNFELRNAMTLKARASHALKSDVASYFNCLDPMNALLPLTTSLVSHDSSTDANGIMWPKTCCTSF